MIFFKKQFFDLIKTHRKTTTLRYWTQQQVKPDTTHIVPHLGKVHIESINVINESDLTQADAISDGFKSLKDLKRTLKEMYTPQQRNSRNLYLIKFKFLEQVNKN